MNGQDFRLYKDIKVEWGDLDAARHVNNVIYFKWTESIRVDYFMDLNNGKLVNEDDVGPVVAWQDCKYIKPINFPDTVMIGIKRSEVLDDRIVLETKIFSRNQKKLAAIMKQHIVSYDFKRRIKAPLPLNWVHNE